ncbi:extracellular solute-binding protein [Paenibacillus radicis (ex Xue et al. 2023)]|uniref:Extracellular solute-binding protein n=1 Tax=Paenibacillus radicis (ex Xue et al. 2023) TaxID=2972489 RepID=A0ABT1YDE1_9BACL|nr:extracellular solute-binding protein [Paenibacillus radicis (ex Xue et al. 2023)]MCR8631219.1 extracellular solute-binding protein [Paenibacillus radicis (ex Xue et al. 2023)]
MLKSQWMKGLTGAVVVSVALTGCQTGSNEKAVSAPEAKAGEQGNKQANADGKVLDKKIEISVFMKPRPESVESNDLLWMKPISDQTNVNFKWLKAPTDNNDYIEKFNLTLAGGSLPDLMQATPDLLNKGGENGVFEPLNKLIDQYMPNFKKLVEKNPAILKDIKSDDGNIYFFPQISAVKTINLQIYRQDWLDKLGLKEPKTTDEIYQVLKAFKEKDPNGNGKNDEIPFTTRNKVKGLLPFVEPFGVSFEEEFYVDNGKVKYTFTDPRLKDALAFTAKLYSEGLIDKEYITNDQKIWESRFSNEVSGATFDSFPRVDYLEKLIAKVNPNVNMTGVIPPQGPNGAPPYTKSQQTLIKDGFAISSKSKYKVELAKVHDWFYSPEGQLAMNFGKLGETYTMENNEPKYTDLVMKDKNNSPLIKMYELGHREFAYAWDIRYENAMVPPKLAKIRDSVTPFIKDKYPVTLSFKQPERDVLNSKFTEITTYKDEMLNKFIMGSEPLSKFDDYVKQIDKMGIDAVLKIQQASYDRYVKR